VLAVYCDSLGATAGCTICLTQLSLDENSDCGIIGDAWFGSDKAAMALAMKGYNSILHIKKGHGLFLKTFVDDALKDAPRGVWIVLEAAHQNVSLVVIGYMYSTRKTLPLKMHVLLQRYLYSLRNEYTDEWGTFMFAMSIAQILYPIFFKEATLLTSIIRSVSLS
jgi:hypothetical protein